MPVYGPNHQLLASVDLERANQLLEEGRCIPKGSRTRVHALLAPQGSEEFLISLKPPRERPDTHKAETDDNPRGVWTFHRQLLSRFVL